MYFEGKLFGEGIEFPFFVKDEQYDNLDDLILAVDEEHTERKKLNNKIKIIDTLWAFGLNENTIALADRRTIKLIQMYEFYKYSPHLMPYKIFFDTVGILRGQEPRLV